MSFIPLAISYGKTMAFHRK